MESLDDGLSSYGSAGGWGAFVAEPERIAEFGSLLSLQ